MSTSEIRAEITAIARDATLRRATNFARRAEALDHLEFNVIDRLEGLLQAAAPQVGLGALRAYAERVRRRLEAVDAALFQDVRAELQAGRCRGAALIALLDRCVPPGGDGRRRRDEPGYDSLDLFMNGLLLTQPLPAAPEAREPEMVYYQQTPARIILELAERARLTAADTLFDLGSGLGQVPIMVNLLSDVPARGVEVEPAYCAYARARAAELGLAQVAFSQTDARDAAYGGGSVFFMYTPFTGHLLQSVLERLRAEAARRTIRLFTYGPCTPSVAAQSWLAPLGGPTDDPYTLAGFASRGLC